MPNNPFKPEPPARDHEPWQNRAECAGTDPEMWFTFPSQAVTQARMLSRLYCDRCPVIEQCAKLAQETTPRGVPLGAYGVWAGRPPMALLAIENRGSAA